MYRYTVFNEKNCLWTFVHTYCIKQNGISNNFVIYLYFYFVWHCKSCWIESWIGWFWICLIRKHVYPCIQSVFCLLYTLLNYCWIAFTNSFPQKYHAHIFPRKPHLGNPYLLSAHMHAIIFRSSECSSSFTPRRWRHSSTHNHLKTLQRALPQNKSWL